jgi:hypothetical protein
MWAMNLRFANFRFTNREATPNFKSNLLIPLPNGIAVIVDSL